MAYPYVEKPKPYVPIGENATPEQGWQPTLSEQQVNQYINLYKQNPASIPQEKLDVLQKHAVQYNIPFYTGDFDIMGALKEFGKGVIGGFTTLDPFDPPDNQYEAIVRNIGHLAGFAPGIAAGPLKMLRVPALAKAASALNQYSIPMMGANMLTKKAKSIIKPALAGATSGRNEAFQTASKFLLGGKVKHMAEGAFHLGAASAISSWQQGVDGMVQSAFGGAIAGGGFRAIGNVVNLGSKGADTAVKTLAGSLFQGLPSTMRGATTPEQVYDYLLGAYFGGKEMPWYKAKAFKSMGKMEKQAQNDIDLRRTMNPEKYKEWNNLEPEVQVELKKLALKEWGDSESTTEAQNLFAQKMGMFDFEKGTPTPEGFKTLDKIVAGQEIVRLDQPNAVVHHGISGRGKGAEQMFSRIGTTEFEVPFVNYTFKGASKSKKSMGLDRVLKNSELSEANNKIRKADESLKRVGEKDVKPFSKKYIQQDWFKVKTSNGIYVIGELQNGGTEVKGNSGWATQMAIDAKKKHVYAFDLANKNWHRYDYKLKRFRMIDKTPKLVKRFAGIGDSRIKAGSPGEKAIRDLFKVTFGKGKVKTSKDKEAVSEGKINVPDPALLKEYNKLGQEETKLTKNMQVNFKDSKDKTLSESQRIFAENQFIENKEKLEPIKKRLIELEEGLETTKPEEITSPDPTEDGNDLGMISTEHIEKKSVSFVSQHLKELWDVKGNSNSMKLLKKAQLSSMLTDIVKKSEYSKKNVRVNEEGIVKELEEKIADFYVPVTINQEGKSSLRQWLTLRNFGNEVSFLRVDDRGVNIPKKGEVYTRAGNKMLISEPKKAIEEVYERYGIASEDPVYVVLNTITEGKDGHYRDLSLSNYRRNLIRISTKGEKAGLREYHREIGKIFEQMNEKGYYPFGGKSDADAIFFVKKHPLKSDPTILKKLQNAIFNKIGKKGIDQLRASESLFTKTYGDKFDSKSQLEMTFSNMLYDLDLNGLNPRLNGSEKQIDWTRQIGRLLNLDPEFHTMKNATAWNKRQQIWFTPGFKADPEYIKNYYKSLGVKNDLIEDSSGKLHLRYILSKDVKKEGLITTKSKNSEDETSVDGMTTVRDDVLDAMNADAGFGEVGLGQNKNFIVSPNAEHGALLAKHMMHSAGKEMSAAMKKKGIHMIMQESAVKQRGSRKLNGYSVNADKSMSLDNNSNFYDIPISTIKYNYSVVQGKDMLNPKRIPKQVLTHITQNTFEPFTKEMMKDFFDSTVIERYEGNPEANRRLDNYIRVPNDTDAEYLINNIDKIGISRLLQAIKNGTPEFSDAAYAKIMKFNREMIRDLISSGEVTKNEVRDMENELIDFETPAERMIKEGSAWSKSERLNGRNGDISPIFLHKNVRNFRLQVMKNFVMDAISKPTVENSAAARMRGYDEFFKADKRFKDLETNDSLFYLDNGFKDLKIKTHLSGYTDTTLEKLWTEFNNSKNKRMYKNPEVKEILRAATVRVPMDATSGMQVLEFAGFTDRKGHGILMHSRAMKAEGGADLDGDESFVFFGGRKGKQGKGWKKEWKDAFRANKEEFYEENNSIYKNKTDQTREDLTFQDSVKETGIDPANRDSAIWKYNPGWRVLLSERAVDGRNQLGSAVVMTQLMKQYHNELANTKSETKVFYVDKEKYILNIKPKKDIDKARKLSSSMIAFSSDPMDEAGLKNANIWYTKLHKAYFDTYLSGPGIKGKKLLELDGKNSLWTLQDRLRYTDIYSRFTKTNRGLYSRNWSDNRSFNMDEISELTSNAKGLSDNSMLSRIGKLASRIDMNDSIFSRVNIKGLDGMYKEHLKILKESPELANILERSSIAVEMGPVLENIKNNGLYEPLLLEEIAKNQPNKFWSIVENSKLAKNVTSDTKTKTEAKDGPDAKVETNNRRKILKEYLQQGEDFLTNDVTDMISFQLIKKYSDGIRPSRVAELNRHVQKTKVNSWLSAKERKAFIREFSKIDKNENSEFVKEFNKLWLDMFGSKQLGEGMNKSGLKPGEEISSLKDLVETNLEIENYKKNLNAQEKKLYDMMMLGSANRGKLKQIKALEEKWGKKLKGDELYKDVFHHLKVLSSKTSTSMLGFNAEAIDSPNVREFMGEFSTVMKKAWKPADINFESDVKKAKEFEKDSYLEAEIDINVEGDTLPEVFSGFEGLTGKSNPKVTLSPAHKEAITELSDNLKFYNNKLGVELNEIIRGVLKKDLNTMTLRDFVDLNNYFKEIKGGTIWQKLFNEKTPDMRRRYWLQFPETVNRELMKYDILFLKKQGLFITKKGTIAAEGNIRIPTNILTAAQEVVGRMAEQGQEMSEAYVGSLRNELSFLEGILDGENLRMVAVREAQLAEVDRIKNSEGMSEASKQMIAKDYIDKYNKQVEDSDYERIKNETYYTSKKLTDGTTERVSITGKEVVEKIKTVYENHFKKMYDTIEGTVEGKKKMKDRYIVKYRDPKTKLDPIVDHNQFIRDVQKSFNLGKGMPMDIGLTNLRRIARSMMIELAPPEMKEYLISKKINSVGQIAKGYWPHMHFNKKDAMKALKRSYEYIKNDMEMSDSEKEIALGKLLLKSKSITGDWSLGTEDWDAFDSAAAKLKEGQLKRTDNVSWPDANQMTGNMHTRTTHIGGYSIDAQAAESYTRNQISTYYKQMTQIMSRQLIHKFNQRGKKLGWDKIQDYGDKTSLLTRWNNYLRLYLQDSMGNPSIVPQHMIDDPGMKLKGSPYAWWADNKVKEKANKIAKKLGIRGKNLLVVKHDLERIDYNDIRNWSNMEAKFELMSLLAHPKSAVANIFGGSIHTGQSVGIKYLRKARDIKELQKIFPNMKSIQDADDYVVSKGVLPEFITNELGMSREAQGVNTQAFIKDIGKKVGNSFKKLEKSTIRDLGRKHKVGESIMNKAAQFMSVPERVLRRDSYMAHLIKAWEMFGGTIKNPDHPFLVEMAKKGVRATQFLYSAPYRPAFARTALGKVMTRFQLWSWNAVKFRNDVFREAKIRGFRQGTAEFERFKRTMQADAFVLALANVFAYSLFDSALPAPYNYLKDTAEWVFGDEEERNKAFFGTWPSAVAPLQMITPPIMRLPVAGLRAFLDNDYEKIANYHVYTMMPFGRMVRDVSPLAKGNLIDNPHRLLEKLTGMPLGDASKLRKKIKERELYHPKFEKIRYD